MRKRHFVVKIFLQLFNSRDKCIPFQQQQSQKFVQNEWHHLFFQNDQKFSSFLSDQKSWSKNRCFPLRSKDDTRQLPHRFDVRLSRSVAGYLNYENLDHGNYNAGFIRLVDRTKISLLLKIQREQQLYQKEKLNW